VWWKGDAVTEAEWLGCNDPMQMVDFLRGKISDRKLRLFACACACAYRVEDWRTNRYVRSEIDLAERWAEGLSTGQEVDSVRLANRGKWNPVLYPEPYEAVSLVMRDAPCYIFADLSDRVPDLDAEWERVMRTEVEYQRHLLGDIFGNPFRPLPPIDPAWLTWNDSRVKRLAEDAYEERELPSGHLDRHRLDVLADALEEAGGDADMVTHLRGPGPHVRGCFVLDALLRKR
jgi:hypothetical protein